MVLSIKANDADNGEVEVRIDRQPDCCPLCDRNHEPFFISATKPGEATCQIVYRCTNRSCGSFYIAYYQKYYTQSKQDYEQFNLVNTKPRNLKEIPHDEEIKKLSPKFCSIFQEASFADSEDFKQIAGIGYRKALEFLIKDLCIKQNPNKKAEIKKERLMKCIRTYINDSKIKNCAERATWLGNDEAHYVRVWKNKDINDLKNLIQLTKYWILADLHTEKYDKLMKRRNK